MIENSMAQPSPLRHPNNPHVRVKGGGEIEIEAFGLDLRVEYDGYTLLHVWAGDADIDILPVLNGGQEETLLDKISGE